MDNTSEVSQILRVTRIGLWSNLSLFVLKLIFGVLVASAALIADAVHTISDLVTDCVVLAGVKLSSRPVDDSHDYGHGKYETVAASIVALLLIMAGCAIAITAGLDIYHDRTSMPGYPVLAVAAVSIAIKEWLFRFTRQVGRRVNSTALHVNAWHHRSDALSSIAVLFGAIAGLAGWGHGDHAAAVAVGVMIVVVGLRAIRECFIELSEGTIASEERQSIINAIGEVSGVRSWHKLRTRLVGREVFMDIHVRVDARLSVDEGHQICCDVEQAIARTVKRPINIVVHCEPDRRLQNS